MDGIILSQPGPFFGMKMWLASPEAHGCKAGERIHGRKICWEEMDARVREAEKSTKRILCTL